jgi:RNA polymerase-binding transcription factor DksA
VTDATDSRKQLAKIKRKLEERIVVLKEKASDRYLGNDDGLTRTEQSLQLADFERRNSMEPIYRREIGQIQAALLAIKNHTYGICSVCRKEINPERMEAHPSTTKCIDCCKCKKK